MMSSTRIVYLAVVGIVCFAMLSVTAQEVTRGAIVVRVQDSTGAVIPGATVRIVSGGREITGETGKRGEVLFPSIIPGSYDISVTKAGFQTAEISDVDVRLGERRPVSVTLEPGDVLQTVEVIAAAGGIDLTTTTTGGHIQDKIYETIPLQRGLTNAFYLAPGVSDGGGTGTSNPSIGGASGYDNLYLIDSVNVSHSGFGGFGTVTRIYGSLGGGVTTSFIKEVEVMTGGYDAQYGGALGGIVKVITKTGGNEFHGAVFGYISPNKLETERKQANRFRVENFEFTETLGKSTYDFGFELSGPIIKDRLSFFASLNPIVTRSESRAPQVFDLFTFGSGDCNASTGTNPLAGCSDLGSHDIKERSINFAVKLTGQITENHRVEASLFGDPTIRAFAPLRNVRAGPGFSGTLDPQLGVPSDFSRLDFSNLSFAVRYNGVISPTWLVNTHFANNHNRFEEQQLLDRYQVEDRTVSGVRAFFGGVGNFANTVSDDKTFSVDNTNIIDAGPFGQHELTQGFLFSTSNFSGARRNTGPEFPVIADPLLVQPGDVGKPTFGGIFRLFSCMTETNTPDCFGAAPAQFQGANDTFIALQRRGSFEGALFNTIARYTAAYAQDNWKMNDYLTVKLGLRWEQEKLIGTQGIHYTYSNSWGPRLGAIVDPFGTRKTKISFNFARFFQRLPNDLSLRALSGEAGYLNLRYWVDPSKTIIPDQAHYVGASQCALPSGATSLGYVCVPLAAGGGRAFSPGVFNAAGGAPPLPGTKASFQDEFGVGIKHEIKDSGVVIGGRYIDRRLKRLSEDSNGVTLSHVISGLFNIPFVLLNPSSTSDNFVNPRIVNIGAEPCWPGTEGATGAGTCFSLDSGDIGADGIPDGNPDPVREYQAVEITFERRMRDNWQFFANWRIARLNGNFEGSFRNDNLQPDPGLTSLFDLIEGPALLDTLVPGKLPNDRTHIINAYGSYMFNQGPANGLNIGMGIRVSTGKPLTELLAIPLFETAGEIVCNTSALSVTDFAGVPLFTTGCDSNGRGAFGRTDTVGTVDLHADYPVRLTERFRLRGGVDAFNIANARRSQDRRMFKEASAGISDPDFNTPSRFQRPFNMRFSLRLEW